MESTARMQEQARERTQELTRVAQRGLEPMANWIETSQRLWLDLWHVSTDAARENFRMMTELQASTIQLATTPLNGWSELQKELGDWYQRTVRTGMESVQRACTSVLENGGDGEARAAPGGGAGEPPVGARGNGGNGGNAGRRRRARA